VTYLKWCEKCILGEHPGRQEEVGLAQGGLHLIQDREGGLACHPTCDTSATLDAKPLRWKFKLTCLSAMDQITIKTPSPKFRLYWCLTEFIDWRMEIQSVMLVFSNTLVN
jgi:hypothetical protein